MQIMHWLMLYQEEKNMKEILSKLVAGNNLTKEEAMRAQEIIQSDKAKQAQNAS